jgi:hypothetical protein
MLLDARQNTTNIFHFILNVSNVNNLTLFDNMIGNPQAAHGKTPEVWNCHQITSTVIHILKRHVQFTDVGCNPSCKEENIKVNDTDIVNWTEEDPNSCV